MTVTVRDELGKRFRMAVVEKYGKKEGRMCKGIEEALELWLEKSE